MSISRNKKRFELTCPFSVTIFVLEIPSTTEQTGGKWFFWANLRRKSLLRSRHSCCLTNYLPLRVAAKRWHESSPRYRAEGNFDRGVVFWPGIYLALWRHPMKVDKHPKVERTWLRKRWMRGTRKIEAHNLPNRYIFPNDEQGARTDTVNNYY